MKSRELWISEPAAQQSSLRGRYRCIVTIKLMVIEARYCKQEVYISAWDLGKDNHIPETSKNFSRVRHSRMSQSDWAVSSSPILVWVPGNPSDSGKATCLVTYWACLESAFQRSKLKFTQIRNNNHTSRDDGCRWGWWGRDGIGRPHLDSVSTFGKYTRRWRTYML